MRTTFQRVERDAARRSEPRRPPKKKPTEDVGWRRAGHALENDSLWVGPGPTGRWPRHAPEALLEIELQSPVGILVLDDDVIECRRSRFAVKKFMTTRWVSLTGSPGVGLTCGFRPKSRTNSSGVMLTRQKFVYTVESEE